MSSDQQQHGWLQRMIIAWSTALKYISCDLTGRKVMNHDVADTKICFSTLEKSHFAQSSHALRIVCSSRKPNYRLIALHAQCLVVSKRLLAYLGSSVLWYGHVHRGTSNSISQATCKSQYGMVICMGKLPSDGDTCMIGLGRSVSETALPYGVMALGLPRRLIMIVGQATIFQSANVSCTTHNAGLSQMALGSFIEVSTCVILWICVVCYQLALTRVLLVCSIFVNASFSWSFASTVLALLDNGT